MVVSLALAIILGAVSMAIRGTGADSDSSDGSGNEVDPMDEADPDTLIGDG